jgi:hypothetical protein
MLVLDSCIEESLLKAQRSPGVENSETEPIRKSCCSAVEALFYVRSQKHLCRSLFKASTVIRGESGDPRAIESDERLVVSASTLENQRLRQWIEELWERSRFGWDE